VADAWIFQPCIGNASSSRRTVSQSSDAEHRQPSGSTRSATLNDAPAVSAEYIAS
jgi:hypothetical protein